MLKERMAEIRAKGRRQKAEIRKRFYVLRKKGYEVIFFRTRVCAPPSYFFPLTSS
jgi:hypothetical protein